MDTRATRLRNAARAAVKEALEKENAMHPRRTAAATKTGKTTARSRGLSTVTNGATRDPARRKAATAVTTKPSKSRTKTFVSSVRKPPDWAAVHAQEEARKQKKMQALKKKSTTSENVQFHSDSRRTTRNHSVKEGPPSGISVLRTNLRSEATSGSENSEFMADSEALSSILSNSGVQQMGLATAVRQTLASSTHSTRFGGAGGSNRGHEEGLKAASRSIEMLQLKRASLYVGQRSTANGAVPSTLGSIARERQSMYAGAYKRGIRTEPSNDKESVIQRDARQMPTTPGRYTIGSRFRSGLLGDGAVTSAPQGDAAVLEQYTAPVVTSVSGIMADDLAFQANEAALDSITSNRGVTAIADKAKRASVYHGPMRVTKNKKSATSTTTEYAATPMRYAPTTPSRFTAASEYRFETTATPLSTVRRFTLGGLAAGVEAATPSQRWGEPPAYQTQLPQSMQKKRMMATPKRSAALAEVLSSHTALAGGSFNPKPQALQFDDQSTLDDAAAALQEIRRQEQELEAELERELMAEAGSSGLSAQLQPDSFVMEPTLSNPPDSHGNNNIQKAPDDISVELININSSSQSPPQSVQCRTFSNPVIVALEPNAPRAFEFMPIKPSLQGNQPTFGGSAFKKAVCTER